MRGLSIFRLIREDNMETRARNLLWNKSVTALVTVLAAAALLLGSVDALAQSKKIIKIGSVLPADHPATLGGDKLAEIANARAGDAIEVRVFPSEQLGSEREMFEGIRLGSIEMGYIAGNVIQNAEPSAALHSLPYLFKGFKNARVYYKGFLFKDLKKLQGFSRV